MSPHWGRTEFCGMPACKTCSFQKRGGLPPRSALPFESMTRRPEATHLEVHKFKAAWSKLSLKGLVIVEAKNSEQSLPSVSTIFCMSCDWVFLRTWARSRTTGPSALVGALSCDLFQDTRRRVFLCSRSSLLHRRRRTAG